MRGRSLTFRLVAIAAGASALALLVAGTVLIFQFTRAVERNFDERLDTLMRALIAATDSVGEVDRSAVEGQSGGSFSRPLSGWYWQIRDARTGQVLDWSESLSFDVLNIEGLPTPLDPSRTLTFAGTGGRELRGLEWYVSFGEGKAFAVLVAGDTAAMKQDIRAFRRSVALTLGIFAVLLALGTAAVVRRGLQPLRNVRQDLGKVRRGEIASLEGSYPVEIEPLIDDLNALLNSNREIVDRARRHVGNLAHALKTPIAVLQNEARGVGHPLAAKVSEQVGVMTEQVGHHLNRARMAAQSNVLGAVTPIAPVMESLARVMRKVHQQRHLDIAVGPVGDLRFRGEKHDLEEMVGNLFDNACKWANSKVRISVQRDAGGRRGQIAILFEDDGPGLAAERREEALSRGQRLDESKPGSGLGLSIVVELARIYGGGLTLDDSALGGLAARLTLPLAADRDS
jgi:signal transduction histidine kinase